MIITSHQMVSINLLKYHMRSSSCHLLKRSVTSFSSIFNKTNLGISVPYASFDRKTGLFQNDLLKDPSGFYLFRERARIKSDQLVTEILSKNRKRKMVEIFDNLSNTLCQVADLSEFIRMGHPQVRFQMAAEEASINISCEVEKLNTNRQLYESLKDVVTNGDLEHLNESHMDQYVARLFLTDFELSGIHLDEDKRLKIVQLSEYILHTGSYFMAAINSPRIVPKSNLSPEIRNCFKSDGDNVLVTGLFAENDDHLIRESAYKIFLHPDDHQDTLLTQLLTSRKQLAKLCGFSSFSERAIRGSIAESPLVVWEFLSQVSEKIRAPAEKDYREMIKLKTGTDGVTSGGNLNKSVKPWDVPYFTAAFKQTKYNQKIIAAAPYFSLGSCMDGINLVISSLFKIQLEVAKPDSGETWHPEVIKLNVVDVITKEILGLIYCDFFERKGKQQQDCHFTIQGGCLLPDASYQIPIVVLMLSLSKPSYGSPSLLTPHQVDNLFHEMGHAIHSMIARTPYQHITGTRCSTDLAEVPSILMEYFSSDPRIIRKFAKHYLTGESIPVDLLSTWIESKKVFSACDTQLQTFYAILDQVYHSSDPLMGHSNTTDVLKEIQNRYYGLEYVEKTSWQLRFGHLVGYGAKYYSYLVSRAVAHSIWYKLFASDPLSPDAGEKYMKELLSIGGGKHPKDLVEEFLHEKMTPEFMSECILKDVMINSNSNK